MDGDEIEVPGHTSTCKDDSLLLTYNFPALMILLVFSCVHSLKGSCERVSIFEPTPPQGCYKVYSIYEYVRDVAVSNDGKWLAVAAGKTTSLYDASTLDRIWSHDYDSWFVSFSPDSCHLVSANFDYAEVSLFDVQTGNLVKSFKHAWVRRAVFSHDGTRVLSGESCSVAL